MSLSKVMIAGAIIAVAFIIINAVGAARGNIGSQIASALLLLRVK